MAIVTVKTKEELKKAIDAKVPEILVVGKLAKTVHDNKKIAKLGRFALIGLGVAIASICAVPVTGGTSSAIAVPAIAAATVASGLTAAEIMTLVAVGGGIVALIVAVFKNYDEIDFSASVEKGFEMCLRRRGTDKE